MAHTVHTTVSLFIAGRSGQGESVLFFPLQWGRAVSRDHTFGLTRSLLGRGVGTGVYIVPGKLAKLKKHKEGNSR